MTCMCVWHEDYWYGGYSNVYNKLGNELIVNNYCLVNLLELNKYDTVGFEISVSGELYFSFNGVNQRLAASDVYSKDKDIYAAVNVSGRCTALRIIRAGQTHHK